MVDVSSINRHEHDLISQRYTMYSKLVARQDIIVSLDQKINYYILFCPEFINLKQFEKNL